MPEPIGKRVEMKWGELVSEAQDLRRNKKCQRNRRLHLFGPTGRLRRRRLRRRRLRLIHAGRASWRATVRLTDTSGTRLRPRGFIADRPAPQEPPTPRTWVFTV